MELENYGYYGAAPIPDGRSLKPVNVIERLRLPQGSDTVDVREGEFRLDTVRLGRARPWVLTRRMADSQGRPVLDSVWLERYSLRTLSSWHSDADGQIRLRFDRRAVMSQFTNPAGRIRRGRVLHEAEPYALLGIDQVLATITFRIGMTGALPVVNERGLQMQWLRYTALAQVPEPRAVGGGVLFRQIWVLNVELGGEKWRYWIDSDDRAVVRREMTDDNGQRLLVTRGAEVPSVQLFPTQPLPQAATRTRPPIAPSNQRPLNGGP